ncbi:MAG TPA: Spy/CpxP family protein refolding chaperone [Thermoanaerobaculia bacterium]|nr:Spy/CpxP family protein refolding chaperone [Thermoanaerobaculia bacterium]
MKRAAIAFSIALLAATAFAQEPPRRMFIHNMEEGNGALAESLGLSADQKVQFDAIHQQLETSIQPLLDQHRAAEHQLQALVESPNPDATAVGTQFLAMRAIDKQIRAAHEATKQKIDAILTPDQKAKFDAMHQKMEHLMGPGGPMMMRHPEGPGSHD